MTTPVFIDTETLGLDPRIHPVWEVAAIADDLEFVWHLDLKGHQMLAADPMAVQISGFDKRYPPAGERTPVDVFLDQFLALTAGRHLCGAVVSFDEERLRRLAWEWGRTPSWHYHLIDVEALAVGFLHGLRTVVTEYEIPTGGDSYGADVLKAAGVADTLPWSSYDVSRALGVEPPSTDEQHSAIADARWAKRLYEAVVPPAVYTEPRPVPARWRDLP